MNSNEKVKGLQGMTNVINKKYIMINFKEVMLWHMQKVKRRRY